MAKKKRQDIGERYLDRLRELGIASREPSPALVSGLMEHWGKDRETDRAIAFLLGRIPDRAAAEALTSRETGVTDKELKREIRRALYKLAQRGVEIAPAGEDKTSPHEAVIKLGPEIEAYMSAIDGAGVRMLWLVKPQMGGGIALLEGLVGDRDGLLQVGGARVRRKELRQMLEESKQKHQINMVTVPWEYADRLLYEGFERAQQTERKGLEEFTSLRSIFTFGKPKQDSHPVFQTLDSESVRAGAWRSLSQRLLEEPEFQSWVLDREWIEPYLRRVEDAQESRLVLNQAQKEERVAAIVRTAVAELFAGERGEIYQKRLEDMALYLTAAQRVEEAKLALAVSLALRDGDWGGLGALDITFLTRLTQKSFGYYVTEQKTKAAEEPSFIVRP
jgi:hypothetical protein